MTVPPPPPLEYDPETGTYRASARYSSPVNLLWALVFGLVIFGVLSPVGVSWIMIGSGVVLAVILVAANRWSARRRRRHQEQPDLP